MGMDHYRLIVIIVQGNGFLPDGTKPLSQHCIPISFILISFISQESSQWLHIKCWPYVAFTVAVIYSLRWRHNRCDSVSNHQPHDCLLNRLFRRRSQKTSKLRVTGLCAGNSPGTREFPAQMASNAENVSIWWRHPISLSLYNHYCYGSFNSQEIPFCITAPLCGEVKTQEDSLHRWFTLWRCDDFLTVKKQIIVCWFTHILRGCFPATWIIALLSRCQSSKHWVHGGDDLY